MKLRDNRDKAIQKIRNFKNWPKVYLLLLCLILIFNGCVTNPVTGRREIILIPTSMEIEMGKENYLSGRQMQGGDYVAEPKITEYVQEVGRRIAAVSDRKLPYEFVVVNDSTPNAWAMPGGKIAVHRGLLTELGNEAELAAVLAHEVVHTAARHNVKSLQGNLLLQGGVAAVAMVMDKKGKGDKWQGLLAVGGAEVAAVLINQKYSRDAEKQADHYGMLYMAHAGYNPQAAVTLQETFVKLAKKKNKSWLAGLFSSHPPSPARVQANRDTLTQLPKGGELGAKRYKQRIARLINTKPAYEAYGKGIKALNEGDIQGALKKADKAISLEPKEALFYVLRGDALAKRGLSYQALAAYNQALQFNSQYYYIYQQKGLLLYNIGNLWGAQQALKAGVHLLKTAPALHTLGRIALTQGRYEQARRYFKEAAESNSQIGRYAWADLLRLDLPNRAGNYLSAKLYAGDKGELVLEVSNNTPLTVRDVVVYIETAAKKDNFHISGNIKGGETRVIRSKPANLTADKVRNFSARVVSARLLD